MRLLNTSTLKVEEFFDNAIPSYAILSHTWGPEEVTFQDMLGTAPFHKEGYQKLLYSCKQAKRDYLEYIWIDTCCIDKTSSAELSEAINSMYRWYEESVYCYVYLSDVLDTTTGLGDPGSSFRRSRWFTRGWTLQELVAPERRIFFSVSWTAIGIAYEDPFASALHFGNHNGQKLPELKVLLAEITGIDVEILNGAKLSNVSVARRMSWAAKRETTRTEDMAYCLMGMFDVNMPLLYGEGMKAFIRLQDEILKSSDDESLFAHTLPLEQPWVGPSSLLSLLAPSPACFSGWGDIEICQGESRDSLSPSVPASLTSKGLRVQLPLCYNTGYHRTFDADVVFAPLDCRVGKYSLARLSIPLARVPYSRDQFRRLDPDSLYILSPRDGGPGIASIVEYSGGKLSEWSNRCLLLIPSIPFKSSTLKSSRSVRISDIRIETIYVVSTEDYLRKKSVATPYFQLQGILQPLGYSLVLENVYPREWWDNEGGILQTPNNLSSSHAWVSGVLSFRDKETGLELDILLGGNVGETIVDQSGYPSPAVPESLCGVSRVDHPASNLSNSSDTRLRKIFTEAEFHGGNHSLTTPWIEPLVAKVAFEKMEFLGRKGFAVQVEIS